MDDEGSARLSATVEDIQLRETANAPEAGDAESDTRAADVDQAKTILLFSDGTGNSSGKLNRTNVWRLYQAVDLGVPGTASERIQIGRYDNGVGTTRFRPIALIQGIFGWGLKRNILSLYLFLCRNHRPEDRICLFGFSRGAFTMRVLADLIDKQGIIDHHHDDDLPYLVADAYRAYRRNQRPRMFPMRWLVPLYKWIRDGLIRSRRKIGQVDYRDARRRAGTIDFIGLWDTVGAYGGPILEFVRAVDDWIMPISFTDRHLPECVSAARHALALDDERDSFQPLPWDERSERQPGRIKQVWFAGMHSDVGGGYPDDSLSYVSFNWMVREAQEFADIRFRKDRVLEALEQADSFGPIHDSRAGPGVYYRYQPRRITALMWPPDRGGRYLIDPEERPGQGMLPPINVHESVFRRIASGTDGYAPIVIPSTFNVVEDVNVRRNPAPPGSFLERIRSAAWQAQRGLAQDGIWDIVWKRRVIYFVSVVTSLALLSLPIWARGAESMSFGGYGELLRLPPQALDSLTLETFHGWFDGLKQHPYMTTSLIVAIVLLFKTSRQLETRLRNLSRDIWLDTRLPSLAKAGPPSLCIEQDGSPPPPRGETGRSSRAKSLIYRIRNFSVYQDTLRFVRWTLLPSVVGIALLAAIALGVLSAATLGRLTWNAQDDIFCGNAWPTAASEADFWMTTDNPCNMSPVIVAEGQSYSISLAVPDGEEWRDGGVKATPAGLPAGELMIGQLDRGFVGMRRALDARWMQPLVYIVSEGNEGTRTEPLQLDYDSTLGAYHGTFTANQSGRLAIAVNEAVPPWPFPTAFFYDGRWSGDDTNGSVANAGGACVRITQGSLAGISGSIGKEECRRSGRPAA